MSWRIPAGVLPGVSSETTIITTNTSGTVHAAGWANIAPARPAGVPATMVTVAAAPASRPPTTSPVSAPVTVSFSHQIPSTSNGENVDAATANARPTVSARPTCVASSETDAGTATAMTAPIRKPETLTRPRSRS